MDNEDNNKFEQQPIKKTISDKTKYIIMTIILVIFVGLITTIVIMGNKLHNQTNQKIETKKENILVSFNKAMDSKSAKLIYFARTGCSFCELQKPILENIAKDNDLEYLYIDVADINSDEVNTIVEKLGIEGATPTMAVVKEGVVLNTNEGYLDGKEFVKFLVSNDVLKKGTVYEQEKYLTDITYKEFKKVVKKDTYQAVFIDTSACSACIQVRSMLSNLAKKNKITINYLPITGFISNEEMNEFLDKTLPGMGYKEKEVKVPLFFITKNGKVVKSVVTSLNEKDYTEALQKYSLIK